MPSPAPATTSSRRGSRSPHRWTRASARTAGAKARALSVRRYLRPPSSSQSRRVRDRRRGGRRAPRRGAAGGTPGWRRQQPPKRRERPGGKAARHRSSCPVAADPAPRRRPPRTPTCFPAREVSAATRLHAQDRSRAERRERVTSCGDGGDVVRHRHGAAGHGASTGAPVCLLQGRRAIGETGPHSRERRPPVVIPRRDPSCVGRGRR
jgi:hypothetical protein